MKTSREELAWCAGFFDGEGYIGSRFPKPSSYARIATVDICQKDRQVLDRFNAAVGVGKVYGPYRMRTGGQFHFLCSDFQAAQAIVAKLWTWLSPIKRAQAKAALSVVVESYRSSPGQPRSRSMCKRGHLFDADNTHIYTTQSGHVGRRCRTCNREAMRGVARFREAKRKLARALLSA